MIIDSPIISGSFIVTGSATVTGSLSVSLGITGSLFGTSSWAVSSSRATTSSYAITASYALNGGSGGATNTGSLLLTASVSTNTITFTKGDGSTFPITIDTGSGGSGTPAGANGEVQFNSASVFAASNKFYWDNDNVTLNLGTPGGTTEPGSLGFPYVLLSGGTSAFGLNYFEAQARETDTGIAAFYQCNGNPAGYGYNFQFKANQASNGLLIIGDNSTTSHIFATDAYSGGAGWPLKFRVANTGENWGAIGDLMTLTPDQKVVITGSLVLPTLSGITDTPFVNFTITYPSGIYKVTPQADPVTVDMGGIIFPSVVEGASFTVITVGNFNAIVNSPFPIKADGADITELTAETIYNFYGIDGNWYGGKLTNP